MAQKRHANNTKLKINGDVCWNDIDLTKVTLNPEGCLLLLKMSHMFPRGLQSVTDSWTSVYFQMYKSIQKPLARSQNSVLEAGLSPTEAWRERSEFRRWPFRLIQHDFGQAQVCSFIFSMLRWVTVSHYVWALRRTHSWATSKSWGVRTRPTVVCCWCLRWLEGCPNWDNQKYSQSQESLRVLAQIPKAGKMHKCMQFAVAPP